MGILEIENLYKRFPVYGAFGRLVKPTGYVNAVSGISMNIAEGETYGLVGESGSGKTTIGRSIVGLNKPDSGKILYNGTDLLKQNTGFLKDIQMIFQDPYSSLNPKKRVGSILKEPLIINRTCKKEEMDALIFEMLETVGISAECYYRFPHELSGGQRQRIGIARVLILNPKIIVCDEPVSALDVSIQSQILNLLTHIQKKHELTLLFITHDICVVKYISNRIGVMHLGHIVEEAATEDIFSNPLHPYTQALFSATPTIAQNNIKNRNIINGELSAQNNFSGCSFYGRCPKRQEFCKNTEPEIKEFENGHKVSCLLSCPAAAKK